MTGKTMGETSGESLDVVIVGGGLSGVGAACHLARRCPGRSFAILEARDRLGGTWDLFRYPGVRSDSDMHTLGYAFKPWRGRQAIADGPSILAYLREAAREHAIEKHVRFGQRLRRAAWSSGERLWSLEIEADGGTKRLKTRFLHLCSGYYRYDRGHAVRFEGEATFAGRIVHPQFWPDDLDCAGRRVAVIGSGATAITLVPELARRARHVTMIQRSPTWIVSRPAVDRLAIALRRVLPEAIAYRLTRWKNVALQRWLYRMTRTRPQRVRARLLAEVRRALGPDYDVATHFTPRYDPWDQRLCLIPDADLFEAIRDGRASVATDRIARFVPEGVELVSGRTVEADVIVTATGLELELAGGVALEVDGRPVDLASTWSYKGMMCSDVPNLVQTFGYVNASWTLRADLIAEWVCRLLATMEAKGARVAVPRLRESDRGMRAHPWIVDFTPGYMQRALHRFPKQGDRDPWRNDQDYARDRARFRSAPIEDGVLALEP